MSPQLVNVFLTSFLAACSSGLVADSQATKPALPTPLAWTSSPELVPAPAADAAHKVVYSIKDPSVVRFDDRWHIYATIATDKGWSMAYLSFKDWADAKDAKPFFMDQNPALLGYHCAPQVFYFAPHKKWYLIFQSQQPQYCTSDTVSDPMSWTPPKNFFAATPKIQGNLPIDYWIICDEANAYLFFTGDNGKVYRSSTSIDRFPEGMSEPVIVLEDPNRFALFEGDAVYKLKGTNQYLMLIEAIGSDGIRIYKGFLADKLDGTWTPIPEQPFAALKNVTFADGAAPWTHDISHGELIRDGYDQTLTVDPERLQLLYQGRAPTDEKISYEKLPYRLGLLTLGGAPATQPSAR